MSTLGTLKSRIANDIARTDLTTEIGESIEDAIEFYRYERFYFNETRDETFSTVADQRIYTVSDDTAIPTLIHLDAVWCTANGRKYELSRDDPENLERLDDNSAASGQPYWYAWFAQSLQFYPIPDAAYTIRLQGHIEKASPASDAETGNVWMTEAFELIRCRAKAYLAVHVLGNDALAARMVGVDGDGGAAAMELRKLRATTARKVGRGSVVPTQF